jgi:hypothetical protein
MIDNKVFPKALTRSGRRQVEKVRTVQVEVRVAQVRLIRIISPPRIR